MEIVLCYEDSLDKTSKKNSLTQMAKTVTEKIGEWGRVSVDTFSAEMGVASLHTFSALVSRGSG